MTELERILGHAEVSRVARALAGRETPSAGVAGAEASRRLAAVALILRLDARDALEMLMIKRAVYAGDPWSGHVALPGGRREPADATLEETAIRETREETAVDLASRGRVLGALDALEPRTPVLPPIVIAPFVAVVEPDVRVVTSPEVERAFWVPLSALRDPAAAREVELEIRGAPRRVTSFLYEEHTIWGLTERILRQFLAL
jgi:8-oxo-dGTP pyrophosphatase MutT (NUDIX family)